MLLKPLYDLMANRILLFISLIAFLAFGMQLLAIDKHFRRRRDPTVVNLEMAYKKERFTAILKTWIEGKGQGAVPAFRRQLWYDNLWAITYAVLFSSLIAVLAVKQNQEPGTMVLLLVALPLLAALFDIFPENSLYLLLLRRVNSSAQVDLLPSSLIFVASAAARIKFALLIAAFAGFILILLGRVVAALPSLQTIYSSMNNWVLIVISLMASLLYLLVLFPAASRQYRAESNPQITALQLAFTKARFTAVLRAWHQSRGPAAIPSFRQSIKRLDFVFPIIYATFLASIIAVLTYDPNQEPGQVTRLMFLLPFLAAVCDWIENWLHLRILKGVNSWAEIEAVSPAPILLASLAAALKWALLLLSFLAIVGLLLSRLALPGELGR